MKTYYKFLLKNFLNSFFKVFLILSSLIVIINIFEQAEFFKETNINFITPIFLSLINMPSIIFEILPFIFLIATQVFFIELLDNNELQIFKYNGLNNVKIIKIITSFSFFFGLIFIIFFYNLSALLKNHYLNIKNSYTKDDKYLAVITNNGLWIKDEIDNKINIISAAQVDNEFLIDVLITQFEKDYTHTKTIQSKKIDISKNDWILINPIISENNKSKNFETINFKSNFDLKRINSLFSNLSSLTLIELFDLRKNYKLLNYSLIEIDSHLHKLFSYPVYLSLITVLSAVIMFNIGYQKNTLFKIILGILLSVIIYYINFFFNILGSSEKIPLMLSIWFPLIVLTIINITFMIRLNEK